MERESAHRFPSLREDSARHAWQRYGGVSSLRLHSEVATWKATADDRGQRLSGASAYLLRFERGQAPPALGFWSLTMYNGLYLTVANPIHRTAIGDRDTLRFQDDGSLEIYIQHRRPTMRAANWLPAPEAEFFLELSIYCPMIEAIARGWQPPLPRQVDSTIRFRYGSNR